MTPGTDRPHRPATPPEAPLAMPVQDLRARPLPEARAPGPRALPDWQVLAARLVAFGGAGIATWIACQQMRIAFGDRVTWLQFALLVLFTITFAWVAFSFFSMVSALFARPRPPVADPGTDRLVIAMPIYHEDACISLGALVAIAQELAQTPLGARSEIFVLSDSRRPDAVVAERLAVTAARELCPLPLWYRRRADNTAHKSGNIAEFLRRWGGRYDQMLVLDADSVMTGATIAELSRRLASDPQLGLIQTMPMQIGGETILARVLQFAGRIYGPLIARGVATWSGDSGNFWGHNAILRVRAFAGACGLPVLSGKPPFGGPVLSHDFVEAALLVRAGWKVRLDDDLRGSFEGGPPTLLDIAKRERRWAQGNLQHLRLLPTRGLSWVSRLHFLIGVLGFVMSPLWLMLILVGLALSVQVLLSTPEYFPSTYQLFPNWPVFDSRRMLWLFAAAMGLLFTPKLVAVLRAWWRPLGRAAGGRRRLLASALFETLLSALIAPVQMLIQTRQIGEILSGQNSGWEAQLRLGSTPGWATVWRRHAWHVALGLVTLAIMVELAPGQLIWLSPILAGLILAPFVTRYSASRVMGRWARRRRLLITPEEHDPPAVATEAAALGRQLRAQIGGEGIAALLATPERLAACLALTPPQPARPARDRLTAIAAAAKLAHAADRGEALGFLSPEERLALVLDPELLRRWAALPVPPAPGEARPA